MIRQVLIAAGIVLTVSGPLGAQQQAITDVPVDVREATLYETVLRSAVISGGQKLAQQALAAFPSVQLTTEQPIVRGVRLPGFGFHFDVQAPEIQGMVQVWEMLRATRATPAPSVGPGMAPVSNNRTAATGGIVEDDPMTVPGPRFDPTTAYSAYVREALIEALLDSYKVLTLQPGEKLSISASGIDQRDVVSLYHSRKLVITIAAEDLEALREGKITRDQARDRILEDRF